MSQCHRFAASVAGASGCYNYPQLASGLPVGPFLLFDNSPYQMPEIITSPCSVLEPAVAAKGFDCSKVGPAGDPEGPCNCTSFEGGQEDDATVFAYSQQICYALGNASQAVASLLDPINASAGIRVELAGGVGSRVTVYQLPCNTSAVNTGPTALINNGFVYTVVWPTAASCTPVPVPCPAPPRPTPEQYEWLNMEMGAMLCYNMATLAGTQGCGADSFPPASTFNDVAPVFAPNTDQWCKAMASAGAKYSVLVAKHECGFTIFPTAAQSGSFRYDYGIPAGSDIVRDFAASCAAVGVRLGLYYSVNRNTYLGVWGEGQVGPKSPITQAQYADIVYQQLSELWTNYGSVAEVWFDGGYKFGPNATQQLIDLKARLQPHSVGLNGCGNFPENASNIAWVGTESGYAPYPLWNTQPTKDTCGTASAGVPNGHSFIPYEVDVTLQNADTWFYNKAAGYKSLSQLVDIYHSSTGRGGNMLLNVAPPPDTNIPQEAMDLYAGLGNFVKECYGSGAEPAVTALAATPEGGCHNCTSVILSMARDTKGPVSFDRVLLKEELAAGQLVTSFQLVADSKIVIANGSSIGRTLIVLLESNVSAATLELQVLTHHTGSNGEGPSFRLVAVPDPLSCVVPGPANATGCTLFPDTAYVGLSISSASAATVDACCASCRAEPACAFFIASPLVESEVKSFNCTLLSAAQGQHRSPGVTSGAPN